MELRRIPVWPIFLFFATAALAFLRPVAEFTRDDGSWLLDAWLRLKEHDWFTLWITSSQGVKNFPLTSWLLMVPLALHASADSAQWLVIAVQLAMLVLVWR